MLLAFDAPVPFSTMGRRNVSNVPAQALCLLNDPLVIREARLWARPPGAQMPAAPTPPAGLTGFSWPRWAERPPIRKPAPASTSWPGGERPGAPARPRPARACRSTPGADLCHVLINMKEFIFVD